MQYKIITDNKKHTTQIRIKLDSSKITEPKFGSLMLPGKYEHLISKSWALGHFKMESSPGVFLLARADGHAKLLKDAPLELVYSYYKMPSGGIFGIFIHADSKELAKYSPHGFPVFECLLGLDYEETINLIAEALQQYKIHLCVADKSKNMDTNARGSDGSWVKYTNPECIFDLKQEITLELRGAIVENFKDLLMHHSNCNADFQQSLQELDIFFPIDKSPLLESQKPGFFQKLFGSKKMDYITEASPFDEKKKHLARHMETQYPKFSNVPERVISLYKNTFNQNLDDIVKNIMESENTNLDKEFKYLDNENKVYLLVSVFNKTREEVTKYYENISDEADFAYFNFFARHFLNNWPSNNLKYLMHLIVCNAKDGNFQIHNAVGKYGGSPKAPGEFVVFPIDILAKKEKELFFNR